MTATATSTPNVLAAPFDQATRAEVEALLAHWHANRVAETKQAATQLVARLPQYYFGWKMLGVVLHRQGELEAAAEAMAQAVAAHPDDMVTRYNLGCMLWSCNRFTLAQAHCGVILQRQPAQAEAWSLSGMIHASLQEDAAARHAFTRALALDANQLPALEGLGHILMAAGELPAAADYFRQALGQRLLQPLKPARGEGARESFDQAPHQALLWLTLAQLARAGVKAFPFAGTLLGLHREGRLLPLDKDLDFALPFAQMEQACACLVAQGWTEEPLRMRLCNPRSFRHAGTGVVLDLCGLKPDGERLVGGFWQQDQRWDWQRVTEFPAPLALHEVMGPEGVYWALDQPDLWLSALYANWRLPEPDFDTVISAHNLRGFSLLTECFALNRINQSWSDGSWPKVLSLLTHSLRQLPDDELLLSARRQVQQHLASFTAG